MIYRHSDQQVQEYFDNPAMNQSALKTIIDPRGGIQKFLDEQDQLLRQEDLYYEEKKHYIIGNAVDCYISQGEDSFKNKYYHFSLKKKPSDTVKSIVNMVFDRIVQEGTRADEILPFISYKKEIYEAANDHQYSMTKGKAPSDKHLKDPTLAGVTDWHNYDNRWSYMKNVDEYWQNLIEADGKQLLSDDEYNTINAIILSFTTHKHTKNLFIDTPDIDIVYQFPIYWSYLDVPCKGLIDHVRIIHSQKRIQPIDEKTLGDYILRFGNAVKIRRYDVQGAYYHHGLKQNLEQLSVILGKDVTDYEVAPFAFIGESTIKPGVPLIFPMTDALMKTGLEGDGRYSKGWFQGLQIYKEWLDINFSIEKRFEKTNGVVWIDADYEIINQ